jgi:hypothetical protein
MLMSWFWFARLSFVGYPVVFVVLSCGLDPAWIMRDCGGHIALACSCLC